MCQNEEIAKSLIWLKTLPNEYFPWCTIGISNIGRSNPEKFKKFSLFSRFRLMTNYSLSIQADVKNSGSIILQKENSIIHSFIWVLDEVVVSTF